MRFQSLASLLIVTALAGCGLGVSLDAYTGAAGEPSPGGGAGASGAADAGIEATAGGGGTLDASGDDGTAGAGGGGGMAGAGGGAGASGGTGITPPAPPTNPQQPDPASDVVFVMRRGFLGDTDPNGNVDPSAWTQYGFDLDGKTSDEKSTDLCQPRLGANPSLVYTDGSGGIDNSWGENIVPLLSALFSDFSQQQSQWPEEGGGSVLFRVVGLGQGSDYAGLWGAEYGGAALGSAPKWDGSDAWPVTYESVELGDAKQPKVVFPQSYVTQRTWVSGAPTDVFWTVWILGKPFTMSIHRAWVTMQLTPDNRAAVGTLGGILRTQELLTTFTEVAKRISPSFCQGSTLDSILQQIAAASDILSDGTQDPTKTCDGISIGLRFEAVAAMLGDVAPQMPPLPDPCSP